MKRNFKAFTLVEIVLILLLVLILGGIGAWRLSALRTQAVTVTDSQSLATVQRMQELADMEGITLSCPETRNRLLELQQKLAANQHTYYRFSVDEMAQHVEWDGLTWKEKGAP